MKPSPEWDLFAAAALPVLVEDFLNGVNGSNAWDDYEDLAAAVANIADAMVAERLRRIESKSKPTGKRAKP